MARRIHLIPAANSVIYDDVHDQAAPGALEPLEMPVLLIEGAQSPALVSAVHEVLERRLPNAQRHVIRGAGHMAPITHAAEIATKILDFTKQQTPA